MRGSSPSSRTHEQSIGLMDSCRPPALPGLSFGPPDLSAAGLKPQIAVVKSRRSIAELVESGSKPRSARGGRAGEGQCLDAGTVINCS